MTYVPTKKTGKKLIFVAEEYSKDSSANLLEEKWVDCLKAYDYKEFFTRALLGKDRLSPKPTFMGTFINMRSMYLMISQTYLS